uniref:Uncharacterized protein n=1 Tax=Meloidogyne floridensis TaxID=298350 RepID=A0A915NEQ6_9BILA
MSKSEEFMENFWKDMAEKGSYSYGSERIAPVDLGKLFGIESGSSGGGGGGGGGSGGDNNPLAGLFSLFGRR